MSMFERATPTGESGGGVLWEGLSVEQKPGKKHGRDKRPEFFLISAL